MTHVVTLTATGDTSIQNASAATFNNGGASFNSYGYLTGNQAKGLVIFDISSIPAGAVISAASLQITFISTTIAVSRNHAIHRALTQWFEGTGISQVPGAGVNASTWNHRNANGSVAWTGGAGGGSGSDYVAAATASGAVIGTGTYSYNVLADVLLWKAGTATNYGWWNILDLSQDSWKSAGRRESGNSNERPKLVITYTVSEVIAPTAASAVAGIVAPTVTNGLAATAVPAGAVVDTVNPTVGIGGMTFLGGSASAVGETDGGDISFDLTGIASAVGATTADPAIKSSITLEPNSAEAIGETGGLASLVDRTLRPAAATAIGETVGKATAIRTYAEMCGPMPLLFITDGSLKSNGQLDMLNLLGRQSGFALNNWEPTIAQYKSGGTFSASPFTDGRRLVRRSFDNAIEVMTLKASGYSQDAAIQFSRELFAWQELAASYWVSDWADRPIYLVAKAARETQTRYALIYMMNCPQLTNPYAQPFFTANGKATLGDITLRIERGDWKDAPPGEGLCVEVSSIRSWTIQGWQQSDTDSGPDPDDEVTGAVRAMIQANNGDILIGTDDEAKIFRSTDNGLSWLYLTKFSGVISTADSINAFVKDNAGSLYAAVTGSTIAQGIWKSTNNGVSWTKIKSHPSGTGYLDITSARSSDLTAVGKAVASSAESPIIHSYDKGATWHNVPTNSWNQDHIAAAAYPDGVLHTQYPSETYGSVFTFVGTNGYYTEMRGVGTVGGVPVLQGFSTIGGGAGNGGLDMVSFLVKNSSGSFYKRALWAVRSATNTADTEIWAWPQGTYQSGSTSFAKIATIPGKNFNVMYVDPAPTWQQIGEQRTIWAGANGEIWVSYNSGFTWALATTAPVNQVRSIIRTTTGKLLVGGDNAEIFVYTGTGSEGGGIGGGSNNGGSNQPVGGSVVVNSYPLGRGATCNDEVYAANKSSFTNITHVLHYNGSTYSELQFATQPPYAILGTNPTVNKAVYFGSKTSDTNVPGGTFSGVVFDITQIAQDLTIVWEYWNGTTWAALTVQDSSNGFRIMGGGSVHWVIPAIWATTTVNSVLGYWVRARISAVGAAPVYPIHGDALHRNLYIYTPNLPYIEVSADEITGDLPATAQIRWNNRGDDPGVAIDMEVDRLVVGLRSVSRGEYFNAFLNISDTQVPFGFSLTKHADASWGTSQRAPTLRALTVSHPAAPALNQWNDLVTFSIANTVAKDYYGTYHAFVRCYKYGVGANTWQLRLRTSFGTGGSKKDSHSAFPTLGADWEAVDMGEVTIPSAQISRLGNNLGDQLKLTVQGYCTTTGNGLVLYDVVLIPVDEWAADAQTPEPSTSDVAKVKGGAVLDIDSVTNPKASLIATNRTGGDLIVARYQAVNNGPAMLQVGVKQRLWFLAMSYENFWRASPEVAGSVQVFKQQRYLGFRGRN